MLGQMQPEPSGVKHLFNVLVGAGGGGCMGVGEVGCGWHTRRCYPFFGGSFKGTAELALKAVTRYIPAGWNLPGFFFFRLTPDKRRNFYVLR